MAIQTLFASRPTPSTDGDSVGINSDSLASRVDAVKYPSSSLNQELQQAAAVEIRNGGVVSTGERCVQIFVKALTGRAILLNVQLSMTIDEIKFIIETRVGIPAREQRLVFAGKQLCGFHSLLDYNIQNESTIHLLLSLRGGSSVTLDVVRRYAPVFRFHPDEPSFPCSIEYLLQNSTLNYRNFSFPSKITGLQSSKPLSIVLFNDWLYIALLGKRLQLSKSRDGTVWEAVAGFPQSIVLAFAPSLTVFRDQLWVVYSIPKYSQLWATHSVDGQTFSAPANLANPARPLANPSGSLAVIAGFDDNLVLIHLKGKSPDLWMTQSVDGIDWSASRRIEGQQGLTPALAVFQGNLVMVYTDPTNRQLFVSRFAGTSGWTLKTKIRDNGPAMPALAVVGNELYLAYSEPKTSHLKVCRSSDGANWHDPVQIPDQKGGNVAISSIADNLIVIYNAPKASQLWITKCPGGDIDPHPPLDNVTQSMLQHNSGDHFYININNSQYGGQPIPSAPLYYAIQEYEDAVEIAYLVLYGYQPGQTVLAKRLWSSFHCVIPNLGTHQGDLERLAVRLRRGPNDTFTIASVLYEAHGSTAPGPYTPDKVNWEDETHPIVHIALNSHAMQNLNPTVTNHHIDVDVPLFVAFGDWVGNGQWWRPHSDGSDFKRLGLDSAKLPIGDQVWSAFHGQLGKSRTNTLISATSFDGERVSLLKWIFVKLIYIGGLLIKKIPLDKLVGDGPAGPAERPWISPGSGRLLP